MIHKLHLLAALVSLSLTHATFAAVTAEEAKQLGGDKLTAFGAEKAGNKEGTIPPFSNKSPKAPASYNLKDPGQRPNPYNDKPLFTITAQNAAQYADKLDGMVELFKKYPDFKMVIYPTQRNVGYPQYFLDNSIKNATSCKGISNELKLEGCWGGIPFPIPKTGNQVMWNHLLAFAGHAYTGMTDSTLTPPDGKYVLTARNDVTQQYDYYDPKATAPAPTDLVFWQLLQVTTEPARKAGERLVLLDNLDMIDVGRRAYQYIPGQRRVKLAPNLAYDTPTPNTGGASTMDDGKGFLGALDRFDFKLVGKKEKYIQYNTYDLSNSKVCNNDKLFNFKNFPNPDCVRWELHRVWVVEATLKPGLRHIYKTRKFFWDEDTPGAGSVENYDAAGKLYRVTNQFATSSFDGESAFGFYADSGFTLDLQTGVWATSGATSEPGQGFIPIAPKDKRFFSPDAMAGQGTR